MAREIRITRVTLHQYQWELADAGHDYNGFNLVYQPGGRVRPRGYVFTIETDAGITGEYAGGSAAAYAQVGMVAHYLIGKNPLQRELIYNDVKRALRKNDRFGIGPIDIALWDIAGKLYGAPVYELLGGFRTSLPAYASTTHGDENGGLDSPEAYADFAVQCREMGYRGFKIHGWGGGRVDREIAAVLKVRERAGPEMDLMLDPACELNTFADALRVGRACDEARFFWYEDPYKDGGVSAFAYRKLRQMIKTPLCLGEHVCTGLEGHVDFIAAEACDYVHVDADYHGGITGVLKIAHAAEGFGLDVAIHAPGPAHRHCFAAIRNCNYYELGLVHPRLKTTRPPLYKNYSDDLDAIDQRGHVPVPQGPGLGVEIDWEWVNAHTTGTTVWE